MKIAQISPLFESVPPRLYGGTERIVSYLTEELVNQGHEVTLFASGDSKTRARLIPTVPRGLRLSSCTDFLAPHIAQLHDIMQLADKFDILHFHTDYLHFPVTEKLNIPCVTTLHGRLDIPELKEIYRRFRSHKVISVSNSQRMPLKKASWIGTVYHGLPESLLKKGAGKAGYLAFIGRISPEKGVDRAIEIAIASQMKLLIAAKVDKTDQNYFEDHIRPMMNHPLVEFIGEISDAQKSRFLGQAKALLFPINWSEPFGLVLIEAMACGTPVIAFNQGSVPEIVENNVTGYIVGTIDEAVQAVARIGQLSRSGVRQAFESRFTASRMASDYVKLYTSTIENHQNDADAGMIQYSSFKSQKKEKKDYIVRFED